MRTVTVRNVPDAVHRAIKTRAIQHARSTEAEIRHILEQAAQPAGRLKLGSLIASIAQEAGGLSDAECAFLNNIRSKTPAEPMEFP